MEKIDVPVYPEVNLAQIDIEGEIQRIGELYAHYKSLYRRTILLCCSEETRRIKRMRASYKKDLKTLEKMQAEVNREGHKA